MKAGKTMKNNVWKKLSLLTVLAIVGSLLLPLVSYAYTFLLYYDANKGSLSGYVYVQDPTKVSVNITQGDKVTKVTYGTYSHSLYNFDYDDNNTKYYSAFFDIPVNSLPSLVSVNDGATVSELTYYSPGYFYGGPNVRLDHRPRIKASMNFSSVTGSTYLQAGANIVSFSTDANDYFSNPAAEITAIEVGLPVNSNNQAAFDISKLDPSDLILADVTTSEEKNIQISKVTPSSYYIWDNGQSVRVVSKKSFVLQTAEPLSVNHKYNLNLSATSSGNEIILPPNGTDYGGYITAGKTYINQYSLDVGVWPGSIAFIDHIPVGYANNDISSGNTEGSTNSNSPINNGAPGLDSKESNNLVIAPIIGKDSDGKEIAKIIPDKAKLEAAFSSLKDKSADSRIITITAQGTEDITKVELPADQLKDGLKDVPDAVISFQNKYASYQLPLSLLQLDDIAKKLETDVQKIKITITIEKITDENANRLIQGLAGNLVAQPIDYKITAESDGKQIEINNFGNTYVERTIQLQAPVDEKTTTAVAYDPESKEVSFVPSYFSNDHVTIKRNKNSIYAVVSKEKTFDDVGSSSWAKQDIELLASKSIIQGINDHAFGPELHVTRAQFATLLVRSLGLKQESAGNSFRDINENNPYFGYIGAAVKAGLVNGFEDGYFRPDESITREQIAVIIGKALAYTGARPDNSADQQQALSQFSDSGAISSWSKDHVSVVVKAGIIQGTDANQFAPAKEASRAETAAIMNRLLKNIQFIN